MINMLKYFPFLTLIYTMSTVRLHHERACEEMGVVMPEDDFTGLRGARAFWRYLNKKEDSDCGLEDFKVLEAKNVVFGRGRIAELIKNYSPRSREKMAA
jgi:hypothetical protein